jgi:uncharacterized OsmC-like protein
MELDLESITVTVEGGIDYSRYRGEPAKARPGLHPIHLTLDAAADADEAAMEAWVDRIEARCPVTHNVANPTSLSVAFERA